MKEQFEGASLPNFSLRCACIVSAIVLASCSADSGDQAVVEAEVVRSVAEPVLEAAAPSTTAVARAMDALGMAGMNTITYSGTAWRVRNSFRQTYAASPPWPERDVITDYTRTIDLAAPASRATGDTFASNLFLEPPVAGTYTQNIPQGASGWGQQLEIWTTPWGFLKGAQMYGAEEGSADVEGVPMTTLTWQSPASVTSPSGMPYTVTGYIDDFDLVRRVETRVEDAFMGDMLVAGVYPRYQEVNGMLVPLTVSQERGGGGVFGLKIDAVSVNPANAAALLEIPAATGGGGFGGFGGGDPVAVGDMSTQVADGIWVINGTYQALAVEFADHIAVFEAGMSETLGERTLEEVRYVFPDKPVRYLINSHPHSDHTGGIVPFVRDGATIVTHENNVEFLEMALSTPRSLLGEDTMDPQFMGISGVAVLEDDTQRLELHHIPNLHNNGTVVAVIPGSDGILFQADFTLPVEGAETNPFVVDLANYVVNNEVDFEHYIAVHAAAEPQTKADLLAAIGR